MQTRTFTGLNFETKTCKKFNWTQKGRRPRIVWSGDGQTNFHKIKNINFQADLFRPLKESLYEKYDAISDERKIEIKKYSVEDTSKWLLYSEPIVKVATRTQLRNMENIFGGDEDFTRRKYNRFILGVYKNIRNNVILNMINNIHGIQLTDGFVPIDDLEFRWELKRGWRGFFRISVMFRSKQ